MGNLARGHKSVEQVSEEQPDEQPDEQLGHWPPPPVVRALRQYSSYSTTPSRMPIACSLTNFMRSLPETDVDGADESEAGELESEDDEQREDDRAGELVVQGAVVAGAVHAEHSQCCGDRVG